jgi:hypothetical protein
LKRGYDDFIANSISYVRIKEEKDPLKLDSKNLFLGSCFAENLFQYMNAHYIDCFFSPFGNIYNPLSLAASLRSLAGGREVSENELFLHRELWRHFDFDTEKCLPDKDKYLQTLNASLKKGHEYLLIADNLFLTLGTSYAFWDKNSGKIVNNCHKLPSDRFLRKIISIETMTRELLASLKEIRNINKNLKVTISLSPVRHLRDSAEENSLSKARLRCLIEELKKEMEISYFPSYEIMMDQLRDYRWYADDLAHPSEAAVSYIMERFIQSSTDDHFKCYMKSVGKLNSSLNHRLIHPGTDEAQTFISNLKHNFETIIETYPAMTGLKEKYLSQF